MRYLFVTRRSGTQFVDWLKDELLGANPDLKIDVFALNNPLKQQLERWMSESTASKLSLYIYLLLSSVFKNKKYSTVCLHYAQLDYLPMLPIFRQFAHKVSLVTWGSDFAKASNEMRQKLRPIYHFCDSLIFTNDEYAKQAQVAYQVNPKKCFLCRFPLGTLSTIESLETTETVEQSKQALFLPTDKKIIVCGTNASPAQRHDLIIDEIIKMPNCVLDKCFFVFPMTYPIGKSAAQIKARLKTVPINSLVINRLVSNETVGRLRKSTDILINIQTDDQLSGAMQESLFAGAQILTGTWLPYEQFEALNGLHQISHVDKLAECFQLVLAEHYARKDQQQAKAKICEISHNSKMLENWVLALANDSM